MNNLDKILAGLDLAPAVRKVYLSLLEEGDASARTLASRTTIARTSIYDHIKSLKDLDLVLERDTGGKTIYSVQDPRNLENLLEQKIESLNKQKEILVNELPKLIAKIDSIQPKIRFFESGEGMKQMLKDILWHDEITLDIVWSYEHMLEVLGEEFLIWFNTRRVRNKISVRALWPAETAKNKKHIFSENDKLVSRRYLSKQPAPTMSYIVYENKTIFLSSACEAFGFIVDSKEHADLMRMQFEVLWEASK